MDRYSIAIVGGGISGLSSAYACAKEARDRNIALDIVVYERDSAVGGNAHTRVFSLGKEINKVANKSKPFVRWADMGVNDLNLATYKNVAEIMKEIGFYDEKDPNQNLLPLENTDCYYGLHKGIWYTNDEDMMFGVSCPAHSLSDIYDGVLPDIEAAINQLALEKVYPPSGQYKSGHENLDITVGEFFDNVVKHPAKIFDKLPIATQEKLDPSALSNCIKFLKDNKFYPRISAMYFTNDYGPENMLLAAPFLYYSIQEGVGGETPKRMYFNWGAQSWLEYFTDYLVKENIRTAGQVTIEIKRDVNASANIQSGYVSLNLIKDGVNFESIRFDHVIMSNHADDALQALGLDQTIPPNSTLKDYKKKAKRILKRIEYTQSFSYIHTFAGVLPENRDAWRCYNVPIRNDGDELKPYSITYVCNRHQNDANSPQYNRFGLPQFFVTLNPQVDIPNEYILDQLNYSDISKDILDNLPARTRQLAKDLEEGNSNDLRQCVAYFRHNLLNKGCFLSQRELVEFHKIGGRLSFCGAWTHGSGLHEECVTQALTVAKELFDSGLSTPPIRSKPDALTMAFEEGG